MKDTPTLSNLSFLSTCDQTATGNDHKQRFEHARQRFQDNPPGTYKWRHLAFTSDFCFWLIRQGRSGGEISRFNAMPVSTRCKQAGKRQVDT